MNSAIVLTFGITALLFAWRGYRKGFLRSIAGVVTLLIAYPAAIFFTPPFAHWLTEHTSLQGMLVYFIAGFLIFITASILVGLVLNRPARPQLITLESGETLTVSPDVTTVSRLCGAAAGLVIGSVAGLIVVYAISVVQSMDAPASTTTRSPASTFLEAAARNMVSLAAATAADFIFNNETTTSAARAFAEDPQAMLEHVQQVMNDSEQIAAVMNDEEVAAMVAKGDVDGLMQSPDFQALVNDEHVQALMQSQTAGTDSAQATAETLVSAWGRMNQVTSNPEFMKIMEDPELQRKLQQRDMSLMTDPRLSQLAELIFAGEKPAE